MSYKEFFKITITFLSEQGYDTEQLNNSLRLIMADLKVWCPPMQRAVIDKDYKDAVDEMDEGKEVK